MAMERPAAVLELSVLCGVAVAAGVGDVGMLANEAIPEREPICVVVPVVDVLPRLSKAENGSLDVGA